MTFFLIVSDRPMDELIGRKLRKHLSEIRIIDPDSINPDVLPFESPSLIMLDASRIRNYDEILAAITDHYGHCNFIGLLEPDTLRGIQKLKDQKVRVYLRCPADLRTFRKARREIEKNRRYVDPALSDSLVERFLE